MQDRQPSAMSDTPDLFFWPGEAALATQLATWLNAPPPQAYSGQTTRRGLILWRGPDHHLTVCLTMGQSVQHALADWKIAARSLLAHARQNRRTLILVEADTLRRGGAAPLAQRRGHAAPPNLTPNPAAAVAQALARLALLHDADLQTLLDDLTAASLPGPDIALGDLLDLVAADSATAALLHAQLTDAATASAVQLADLTATLTAARKDSDAATLRLQTLDAAAQQTVLAAETRLAAQDRALADREAQVAVLTTQIALLDASLTRTLMAPEPDATQATTDPDYWDKALARALAAARTEADRSEERRVGKECVP